MRKLFTFLFAALMSVGMFAATEVTITEADFPSWGNSFTKDGVTVSAGKLDADYGKLKNGGSFSTTLGNFKKIEVFAEDVNVSGDGWEGSTWKGKAASVSFSGDIDGMGMGTTLKFTIEPVVPVVPLDGDTWDEVTKTLTVNSNLPYEAYKDQTGIEHVIINNGVTSIGDWAFYRCDGLESITIPNSVTSIGESAFEWCSGLTSITIPNSVISIGESAFHQCTGLTSIEIPNSVTSIQYATFADCSNLESVTIPNSVTSIGQIAFASCSHLTSVTIGDHVTSIGVRAFEGCSLTSVTIDATTPPTLGKNAFRYVDVPACKLYVPVSSASDYKAASTWQNFYFYANPTAHLDPQNTGTYYSTFYDSDDIYLLPTGVEAYVATLSGSNLLLTKIAEAGEYIPNNCAVILKSTVESYDLFISKETPVTFTATNSLEGTDDAITTPANCYVLSCKNNLVGFYQYGGEQVAAHKAYVIFSGAGAPRRMPFIFDAATGVENVQGNVQSTKVLRDGQLIIIRNGVEYNANGMMVK